MEESDFHLFQNAWKLFFVFIFLYMWMGEWGYICICAYKMGYSCWIGITNLGFLGLLIQLWIRIPAPMNACKWSELLNNISKLAFLL